MEMAVFGSMQEFFAGVRLFPIFYSLWPITLILAKVRTPQMYILHAFAVCAV